ncbi:MAG: OpgC domain-containing protein [Methylomonas sp.]|nr:OpgC domain-containing protein [Methylomonas sp.]PPD20400.1 MAG: hypothetical protein CTY23_08985 [Methylomonas sp.]PPD25679.1 MAG: hypothetical protein CTY22_07765 [Methylomonas sp.]PPD36656.1 MAG: hypothetical protein CTY21_07765 [Methylomonas sp.]PPD40551.1 MAG: hypothetical protein CTY17_06100 [Methylomonas sp.]
MTAPAKAPRNLGLDFFRGLALIVIFINHMPGNPWFHITPSRLGPSDAAEAFVFLSGFAAALAYGKSFSQAGILLGSVQVLTRCIQLYLAHLALFMAMVFLSISIDRWGLDNLDYFLNQTRDAVKNLLTLRYVPNFIGILPMYLVIMLWLPVVWALSRLHRAAALAFPVVLYLSTIKLNWAFIADPLTGNTWYFNPFCWQLLFFTGFGFGNGWLPMPRASSLLTTVCLLYVVACFPLENAWRYDGLGAITAWREHWLMLLDKSQLGILRYLHFLAMAYLIRLWMLRHPAWLHNRFVGTLITLGQQSLPMFMLGTCLSFVGGMLLDREQANLINSAPVNLAGIAIMLLVAQTLKWLDQKPWKAVREPQAPVATRLWPQQMALAVGLLAMASAPLLLLQHETQTAMVMAQDAADIVVSPLEPEIVTEDVVYQPGQDAIDMPDTL